MRFFVTAECVDRRTGKRFFNGDEFLPAPEGRQADRLYRAGCLEQMPEDAPDLPTDDLSARSWPDLLALAKADGIDLGRSPRRDDVEELIRTKRANDTAMLAQLDHDGLIALAASENVDIAGAADIDAIRGAIAEHRARAAT